MHQRQISFDDPTRLKLAREIRVADVVLGHHEQSRGLFIQAVNDSRTVRPAGLRETLEMVQQSINERSPENSGANVYHHPGWLIDDGHVGIFINNIQWNSFREERGRFRRRQRDVDLFLAAQLVARLCRLAIQ